MLNRFVHPKMVFQQNTLTCAQHIINKKARERFHYYDEVSISKSSSSVVTCAHSYCNNRLSCAKKISVTSENDDLIITTSFCCWRLLQNSAISSGKHREQSISFLCTKSKGHRWTIQRETCHRADIITQLSDYIYKRFITVKNSIEKLVYNYSEGW